MLSGQVRGLYQARFSRIYAGNPLAPASWSRRASRWQPVKSAHPQKNSEVAGRRQTEGGRADSGIWRFDFSGYKVLSGKFCAVNVAMRQSIKMDGLRAR